MQQKLKNGICKGCGKSTLIVQKSKGLCLLCNTKLSLERQRQRKLLKINKGIIVDPKRINIFYQNFWNTQPIKICYETGVPLYTFKSWHVHHLLEKKDYPQYAYNMDVCVLLSLESHSLWHSLIEIDRKLRMPKTYEQYLKTKHKYNIQ